MSSGLCHRAPDSGEDDKWVTVTQFLPALAQPARDSEPESEDDDDDDVDDGLDYDDADDDDEDETQASSWMSWCTVL